MMIKPLSFEIPSRKKIFMRLENVPASKNKNIDFTSSQESNLIAKVNILIAKAEKQDLQKAAKSLRDALANVKKPGLSQADWLAIIDNFEAAKSEVMALAKILEPVVFPQRGGPSAKGREGIKTFYDGLNAFYDEIHAQEEVIKKIGKQNNYSK